MIADDFYVLKVMHYMKKALLYNGINFFENKKILFINKQNEITHSGCKRIIFMQ